MNARILLVDDLDFMRIAIREILEINGFQIIGEAENGKQGVDLYFELKPDIVIMDITMPVMNGIMALKTIKKSDPGAVVVMCSSLGQHEYVIRSIQLGARDFVVKPFRPERILSAVKKAAHVYE